MPRKNLRHAWKRVPQSSKKSQVSDENTFYDIDYLKRKYQGKVKT